MSKNEALIAVCKSLLQEIEFVPGWVKLIAVGKVKPEDGASMFTYSFDNAGEWQAIIRLAHWPHSQPAGCC